MSTENVFAWLCKNELQHRPHRLIFGKWSKNAGGEEKSVVLKKTLRKQRQIYLF